MPTKKTKKDNTLSLNEKVEAFSKDEAKILKKHKLAKRQVVVFPHSTNGKVPFMGRLAMKLLKLSKGVITIQFFNTK